MADNIAITAGAGTTIATEDVTTLNGGAVSSQHIQRVGLSTLTAAATAVDVTSTTPLPVNTAQINGVNITTGSGVTGTGVQRVVLATDVALPTGANVIGALTANQSINNAQINGVVPLMGNGVTGTGSQRVTIASDNTAFAVNSTLTAETTKVIGTVNVAAAQTIAATQATAANLNATVTNLTLTKGTQGATGVSTQDLKDAGRVIFGAATVIAGVTAVTAEALLSMVPTRDGVAGAAISTFPVTSAKRLRIEGIMVGLISTSAAVLSGRFALRMNPSGAATATSPIIAIIPIPSGAALAQAGGSMFMPLPDGLEFSGTHQFGLTQVCSAATGTVWASVIGFEY